MTVLVLLDENLPHRLRAMLSEFDVRTTDFQGWKGLSNGVLLAAAEQAGFAVLLTMDRNMSHQQNLAGRRLAIVVLDTDDFEIIAPRTDVVAAAIRVATPGEFTNVRLTRKRLK